MVAKADPRRIPVLYANAPGPEWKGQLTRWDNGIAGALIDRHGWKLAVTATADGPRKLQITATLAQQGDDAAPWEDDAALHEAMRAPAYTPLWVGTLDRADDGSWVGSMQDLDGWVMAMVGTESEAAGVIALRGVVRERAYA